MKHNFVSIFAMVILVLAALGCNNESAPDRELSEKSAGYGTFSVGFRMGELTKASVKGIMTKSLEGELNLGREGTPAKNPADTSEWINPWKFSAEVKDENLFSQYIGSYVIIEYEQAQMRNVVEYDTEYMATKVYSVTRNYPVFLGEDSTSFSVEPPRGNYSTGVRTGRVVKGSYKGRITKTYEVTIQQGNAGGKFMHMSVTSEDMYRVLRECAKSGKKFNFHYVEKTFNARLEDTAYTIYKVTRTGADL